MTTFDIIQVQAAGTAEERSRRAWAVWNVLMAEAYQVWRRGLLPPHLAYMVPDVADVTLGGQAPTPKPASNERKVNW